MTMAVLLPSVEQCVATHVLPRLCRALPPHSRRRLRLRTTQSRRHHSRGPPLHCALRTQVGPASLPMQICFHSACHSSCGEYLCLPGSLSCLHRIGSDTHPVHQHSLSGPALHRCESLETPYHWPHKGPCAVRHIVGCDIQPMARSSHQQPVYSVELQSSRGLRASTPLWGPVVQLATGVRAAVREDG